MKKRKVRSKVGRGQAGVVMREFYSGKLRDPHGRPITSLAQAHAVAMSEARAAEARGVVRRTFKGRTRLRPKKKKR